MNLKLISNYQMVGKERNKNFEKRPKKKVFAEERVLGAQIDEEAEKKLSEMAAEEWPDDGNIGKMD